MFERTTGKECEWDNKPLVKKNGDNGLTIDERVVVASEEKDAHFFESKTSYIVNDTILQEQPVKSLSIVIKPYIVIPNREEPIFILPPRFFTALRYKHCNDERHFY